MKKFSLNCFTFMTHSDKNSNFENTSLIGIGYVMCGGMIFFSVGGYFLDEYFDSNPIFTLSGIFVGLLYCGYEIWKLTRK